LIVELCDCADAGPLKNRTKVTATAARGQFRVITIDWSFVRSDPETERQA